MTVATLQMSIILGAKLEAIQHKHHLVAAKMQLRGWRLLQMVLGICCKDSAVWYQDRTARTKELSSPSKVIFLYLYTVSSVIRLNNCLYKSRGFYTEIEVKSWLRRIFMQWLYCLKSRNGVLEFENFLLFFFSKTWINKDNNHIFYVKLQSMVVRRGVTSNCGPLQVF